MKKKPCHDNKPVSDKNLAGKFMSKSLKAAALDLSKLAPCYVTYNFTNASISSMFDAFKELFSAEKNRKCPKQL